MGPNEPESNDLLHPYVLGQQGMESLSRHNTVAWQFRWPGRIPRARMEAQEDIKWLQYGGQVDYRQGNS